MEKVHRGGKSLCAGLRLAASGEVGRASVRAVVEHLRQAIAEQLAYMATSRPAVQDPYVSRQQSNIVGVYPNKFQQS